MEGSHDLSGLFWEMITSVDLLDSEIYKTHEARSLPKSMWLSTPCPLHNHQKVMGLKDIHHPDALCCFARLTFCPWCGKEGQNKGTMVNHLWTIHYKLGLVCSGCLCFPLVISEAIWHHSQGCKQPRESDAKEEDRVPK